MCRRPQSFAGTLISLYALLRSSICNGSSIINGLKSSLITIPLRSSLSCAVRRLCHHWLLGFFLFFELWVDKPTLEFGRVMWDKSLWRISRSSCQTRHFFRINLDLKLSSVSSQILKALRSHESLRLWLHQVSSFTWSMYLFFKHGRLCHRSFHQYFWKRCY